MANLFANLPVPAGNGSGAWVDVSLYGKQKTITIDGTFTGSIVIEVSLDGGTTSAQLLTMQAATEVVVDVACDRMRVTRKGIDPQLPGSANVDVGAPALTDPVSVSAIACPAGNGVGATLDITDFPTFKTVSVAGTRLSGSLFIEISDDGTNWDELFTFTGSGQKSASVSASDVRVRRAGVDSQVPGTAVVNIAAVPDADGGGGGGGGGGNVFTFQPGGGGTGPFVFEDWDALVEALNNARDDAGDTQPTGLYYILFDDSVTTPCVIPAGAADDMKGVTWTAGNDVEADVQISNGKTFTNLRSFSGQLFVELVAGAAAAPVSDFADGDIVLIEGGAWIYSSATPPFFNVTGTPSISFRVFNSTLGDGVRDAVAQTAGSSLIIEAYASAEISVAAISGAAASSLAVLLLSSSAYIRNQAAYAGSISIQPRAVPRWSPITTTSPQAGDTVILANPPSTVTLPTLISPFTNGQTVIVKVGAADDGLVTINAAGGQTIDGASSMTFANTSGYGGVILIGNGIAWSVVGHMKRLPQDNVSVPSATPFAATIGSYVAVPDAPYTVTLPALSSPATDGMEVTVKLNKVDADTVTVNPTGSDTIDGAATFTFANTSGYGCATFKASGTNWGVVSKYKTPPQYNVTVPGATPFAASFGAYIPIPDAPYTINLPALSTPATDGQSIVLKLNKNDPDLITVTPNGSDTIDGAASFTFSNTDGYGSVTLIASGTNWGVN